MLAAPASVYPSTPGATRLAAVAQCFTEFQVALQRVARARAVRAGLALSLAWVAGWFALALPFAYRVALLPSTERLLDGIALLRGPLCVLLVWLSGTALAHGGRGGGMAGRRLAANALALACVVLAFLGLGSLAAATLQWLDGRVALDWGLYTAGMVNIGFGLCLWAGVVVSLQALVGERRLGTLAAALALLAALALPKLGAEHPLLHFGPHPMPYSHLAGYGHHIPLFVATGLHHAALTALVMLGAWLLAPRVPGEPLRKRLAGAKRRLASCTALLVPVAVLWLGSGAWICHAAASAGALGEPVVEQVEAVPGHGKAGVQPAILALDLAVDLYPRERRINAAGTMLLANVGTSPIDELAVYVPPRMQVHTLAVPARPVDEDARRGLRRYAFERPLRPVERVRLGFDMAWADGLRVNGTFLQSDALLPHLGRPAQAVAAPPPAAMRFKARLGTALDQIAVAPGELKRTWKENHRRYFEYETVRPIAPRFTVHSGRYAIAKDTWRNVAVEIFHAPAHAANVPVLLSAVKANLERCAMAWGPYPWATFRVVETPHGHSTLARAGIAAYAEGFAFTADLANRPRSQPVFDAIERDVAAQWEGAPDTCPEREPAS